MRLKPVPGAKAQANMDNMRISAWCAAGREACWWHNHPASAPIALEQGHKYRVNIKTDVRSAEAQAGHTYLKTHPPPDECQHAPGKQGRTDHRGDFRDW